MKSNHNNNFQLNIFTVIGLNLILTVFTLGSIQFLTTAQNNTNNSLEIPFTDPLIPTTDRNLSPLETKRIEREIIKINQQATTELSLGNQELAFKLWFRELRLQRALGREAEITALGRIGNIAWQQNRGVELREIAQRLIAIEQEAVNPNNLDDNFLSAIGLAYQKIKYFEKAINIYQKILKQARQQNDVVAETANLEQLGKLYLAKFDYSPAASTYEELLNLVQHNKGNSQVIEVYLLNLIEIYQRLEQPEAAIKHQKTLLDKYISEGKIYSVAKLQIALGNNYQSLEQTQLASQYYQEAYTLAHSLQQLALAADSLTHLGKLYQQENQLELAIAIYQQLIDTEHQANDFYGVMDAYDNLGNIYLEREEYSQALAAFEAGLEIAKSFNYRINYFVNKIEQLK